jgi:hypothetical protein
MIEAGANPDTLAVSTHPGLYEVGLMIGCRQGIEEGGGVFTGS